MSRYTKRPREEESRDNGFMNEDEKMRRFMLEAEEEEAKDPDSHPMTAKQKDEYMRRMQIERKKAKADEAVKEAAERDDNPFAEGTFVLSNIFLISCASNHLLFMCTISSIFVRTNSSTQLAQILQQWPNLKRRIKVCWKWLPKFERKKVSWTKLFSSKTNKQSKSRFF